MRISFRVVLIGFALLVVPSFAGASGNSGAAVSVRFEITLRVYDDAGLRNVQLDRAMDHVRLILAKAGVDVAPVYCASGKSPAECSRPPDELNIGLRIVRQPPPGLSENALGFATGSYITVIYPRVEQAGETFSILADRMLGCVVVHELGHVFLGANSHSESGIMAETWRDDELAHIREMLIGFQPSQRERIRAYVLSHRVNVRTVYIGYSASTPEWSSHSRH